jgi:hypothetical protein
VVVTILFQDDSLFTVAIVWPIPPVPQQTWSESMAEPLDYDETQSLGEAIRRAIDAAVEEGRADIAKELEDILLTVPGDHGGYYRA